MTAPANPYFASPALYDLLYVGPRYDGLYLEAALAARGPILEVACGNGHVLIPLREAGVDIDGLDYDAALLADAGRKLAERGLAAMLVQADMRTFTLPRRYALILIPFNTFLHNLTAADQLATLRCCRDHLADGGALMFDVFVPDPGRLLQHDGAPRLQMEHPHPDGRGTVQVFNATTCDAVEQVMSIQRRVEVLRDGEPAETHDMAFQLRWLWAREAELLLRAAGFRRWAVESRQGPAGGFARKERIELGDAVLWTAWKD
jgi:SAM-dependent methyltransferase